MKYTCAVTAAEGGEDDKGAAITGGDGAAVAGDADAGGDDAAVAGDAGMGGDVEASTAAELETFDANPAYALEGAAEVVKPVVADPAKSHTDPASAFVNSLYGDDGNMITEIRADGMVNATKMCKSAGKLWANFSGLHGTKDFLAELSGAIQIPTAQLVECRNGSHEGTWVHHQVAIKPGGAR